MRRIVCSAIALALSAGAMLPAITFQGGTESDRDPYKRKTRSKGEKARNRKRRR